MIVPLLALALAASQPGDVVARVDGAAITVADVQERIRILAERGHAAAPPLVLTALVDEVLLSAEARREGLDRDPTLAEELAAQRRKLLGDALAKDLADKTKPSEALLRELYHASGDSIRLVVAKFETREEAEAALARVKGGADLREEAKGSVDRALARSAGDTGPLSRSQVDASLVELAFRVPVGELFGPVELKLGWAIGRVAERTVSDESGFEERRDALTAFARRQLAAQGRQHLAEQLRTRSDVRVDEAFLKSLGNRTDATPAELDRVLATVNGKPLRYRALHRTVRSLSSGGGHLAGPSTKVALAKKLVEERLLEDVALERGLDQTPAVSRPLPGIEWNLLASAYVARHAKNPAAGANDETVRRALGGLRGRARIQLDEARLPPAAGPGSSGHP